MPADFPSVRTVVRVVLTTAAVVGLLYLIWLLRRPISFVLLAAVIAIALSTPVNWLARHMRRGFAILIVYLALLAIPAGIGVVIVPPLVTQGTHLADKAPDYVKDAQKWINKNKTLREINDRYHVTNNITKQVNHLPSRIGDAATALSNIGLAIVNSLFVLLNVLILSVFLVASGRRWLDRFVEWRRPQHAERIKGVCDRVGRAFSNYIGGALLQAFIAGIAAFIVMTILGIPFAAPLAVLTFFADLVPLVGATIGAILVGIVTLFVDFPTTTIIWGIFAIVYQQVENTLIQPQIQRRAVEVHPFAVLVGVLCGGTLFGILGALLAIPVLASGYIIFREWMAYQEGVHAAPALPPDELPPPAAAGAAPPAVES
jgi:predicted PurR-regulated permease PerM